jgi:hypothetical protein
VLIQVLLLLSIEAFEHGFSTNTGPNEPSEGKMQANALIKGLFCLLAGAINCFGFITALC